MSNVTGALCISPSCAGYSSGLDTGGFGGAVYWQPRDVFATRATASRPARAPVRSGTLESLSPERHDERPRAVLLAWDVGAPEEARTAHGRAWSPHDERCLPHRARRVLPCRSRGRNERRADNGRVQARKDIFFQTSRCDVDPRGGGQRGRSKK